MRKERLKVPANKKDVKRRQNSKFDAMPFQSRNNFIGSRILNVHAAPGGRWEGRMLIGGDRRGNEMRLR